MRIVVSPRENGRAKEENSINSRHGRRVAKMVDVVLVARVRKVDEGAVGWKEPYEAGDGEVIEKTREERSRVCVQGHPLQLGCRTGKIGEREEHLLYASNMFVNLQRARRCDHLGGASKGSEQLIRGSSPCTDGTSLAGMQIAFITNILLIALCKSSYSRANTY
ncbi:hypothetical protein NC652_005456 [Populus alba x Populus x berolinensis]|nr:hypothetical protein NC652_005456 [Populus alba x Populus x berolinensis]